MNRLIEDLDRACPGFVPGEYDEWPYMWMGSFVRHVIRMHVVGEHLRVIAAFEVIEKEIAGNGPDRELAIVGFLEDMQNGNLHKSGSKPADFRVYLGPRSLERWDGLNGFWKAVENKPKA